MSKSSKGRGSKPGAKLDDEEDEEYMDTTEELQIAEAKVEPTKVQGHSRASLQRKIAALEDELDREVDEEFESMRISSAMASPKHSSVDHARASRIRNVFKINWMNMRDTQSGRLLWESTSLGDELQRAEQEGNYDEVTAQVPREILQSKAVSRELNFTCGQEVHQLRLQQRVFFQGTCIEECMFAFGYVIPGSTNTWQQVIEAAPADRMMPADVLSGKVVFKTSFFDGDLPICTYSVRISYV